MLRKRVVIPSNHCRSIDPAITRVTVGSLKVVFNIYKTLLCASSVNFAAALNGQFKEARGNVLPLDDVDVAVFRMYVDWLYKGDLPNDDFS